MRSRAVWAVLVAVTVAALAVVGGVVAWKAGASPSAGAATAVPVTTATVIRTRLSATQTLDGTLGYGSAQSLTGGKAGTVTWLPASGVLMSRGQALYRVDNEPVPLFYGGTPLYRRLDAVGMVGPDVKVIASNLAALGYSIGYQPPPGSVVTQAPLASPAASPLSVSAHVAGPSPASSGDGHPGGSATATPATSPSLASPPAAAPSSPAGPGETPSGSGSGSPGQPRMSPAGPAAPTARATPGASASPTVATVRPGDAVLTTALMHAIARWQAAEGLASTGILGIGDVLVEPGPVRVIALQAQLGGQGTGALMTVASTAKTVTVAVDSSDVVSVRQSGHVTITLPDGATTGGTIIAVGTSVQSGASSADGQPQQTVTVAPGDPSALAGLTSAPVQVTFPGQTVSGVLAVPVTALLALSGGGYALQLPGGRLIAVQTGMFAQGMVQVSGPELTAGLRVVTSE
jgi:hypothetical protein